MDAAHDLARASGTGMERILGDCLALARVTGESSKARTQLETALGSELAARLVGALARGRRARGVSL